MSDAAEEIPGGEPTPELGQEPPNDDAPGTAEETQPEPEAKGPNYEEIARQSGWKPEEEYEGPEGAWVSAEEFVKRAPLFEKIKGQSKTISRMEKTMEAMARQFTKNSEALAKKHLEELKAAKREAIEVGDADKVEAIEKEMEETKTEAVESAADLPQEIKDFLAKNDWYDKKGNEEMTRFAKAHNRTCLDEGMDLQQALDETAKMVKRSFPDKFENKRKAAPAPVEAQSQPTENGTGKSKYTMSRLSSDQKLVYNQMVKRDGILSHEEYFKSLEEIGELA